MICFIFFITIRPYNFRIEEMLLFLRTVLDIRQRLSRQSSSNFHWAHAWILFCSKVFKWTQLVRQATHGSYLQISWGPRSGVFCTILQDCNIEDDSTISKIGAYGKTSRRPPWISCYGCVRYSYDGLVNKKLKQPLL